MARKATIPRYRKHTRGYAFVRLNGKDIYLGEHGTKRSKAEYDRIVTEWLASGRTLPQQEAPSLTVVELLVKYMRHARTYYGGTPEWRILKAVKIARKLYGRTPAADFGPLALKSCRQVLIDEGVCRGTVNSTIGKLKLIYKWATAEELVPPDVWHRLQAVSGLAKGRSAAKDHDPIAPVPDADVEATLPFLPPVVQAMVRLQRLSAMRPGELCELKPADIDRSGEIWFYEPTQHKSKWRGKARRVALGPQAQEVLRPYLLRGAENHCFNPCESEERRRAEKHLKRKTPMNQGNKPGSNRAAKPKSPAGIKYATSSYRRCVARAAEKAGVAIWAPNQLRHAAATEARREFGLEAAQAILGHARADISQVYAQRNDKLAEEVAKRLG